jgi:hypothetical protein
VGAVMEGQWIGTFSGTNSGLAVLDLDDAGTHFEGHAFAFDSNQSVPSVMFDVTTDGRNLQQSLTTKLIAAVRPNAPAVMSPEEVINEYPNIAVPQEVSVNIDANSNSMNIVWETSAGTSGLAKLQKSKACTKSKYKPRPDITCWHEFTEFSLDLPSRKYIFRGQDCVNRLRTSFHRTRRKDLVRYLKNDIPRAHHTLTAKTKHLFNLLDSAQNGAFLNLLQHHGYPTPLLDWSYSPFVAAFFAYRFRRRRTPSDDKVRIYIFDREAWVNDFAQVQSMAFARPHFSILEALTIENQRAMPQQALSSVTNLDDIESYISLLEERHNKRYLEIIDLPNSERRVVMEHLSLMGITAGTLFPDLVGACEELRGRYFHPFS